MNTSAHLASLLIRSEDNLLQLQRLVIQLGSLESLNPFAFRDTNPLAIGKSCMGWPKSGGESWGEERGVLNTGENVEVGESCEDKDGDDGLDRRERRLDGNGAQYCAHGSKTNYGG